MTKSISFASFLIFASVASADQVTFSYEVSPKSIPVYTKITATLELSALPAVSDYPSLKVKAEELAKEKCNEFLAAKTEELQRNGISVVKQKCSRIGSTFNSQTIYGWYEAGILIDLNLSE